MNRSTAASTSSGWTGHSTSLGTPRDSRLVATMWSFGFSSRSFLHDRCHEREHVLTVVEQQHCTVMAQTIGCPTQGLVFVAAMRGIQRGRDRAQDALEPRDVSELDEPHLLRTGFEGAPGNFPSRDGSSPHPTRPHERDQSVRRRREPVSASTACPRPINGVSEGRRLVCRRAAFCGLMPTISTSCRTIAVSRARSSSGRFETEASSPSTAHVVWNARSASAWHPDRDNASINWPRRCSRSGCSRTSCSNSPISDACLPSSRSASIHAFVAAIRSSLGPRNLRFRELLVGHVDECIAAPEFGRRRQAPNSQSSRRH